MTTANAIAAARLEVDKAVAQMGTLVAAFRRTAAPEVKSSFIRITVEIGREEPFVTGRLGASGVSELMEEVKLLGWDVPARLEELFSEKWIQGCFLANGSWPDDPGAQVYDYIRSRSSVESPFPQYFVRELNHVFSPLGRLLTRHGFRVSRDSRERAGDDRDPAFTCHRIVSRFRLNPALVSGAVLFGEQARRCHALRERVDVLEYTRLQEESGQLWDNAEKSNPTPPVVITSASRPPFARRSVPTV